MPFPLFYSDMKQTKYRKMVGCLKSVDRDRMLSGPWWCRPWARLTIV